MSDKPIDNQEKNEKSQKASSKIAQLNLIKGMSPNDNWNVLEDILQEIEATLIVENATNGKKKPTTRHLRQLLEAEVKKKYSQNPETQKQLLDAIPSEMTVGKWRKKSKWEDAVWEKIRDTELFSPSRRAEMIGALFTRGLTRSDAAAKLYLTMSGDYSDKLDVTQDGTLDKFREINDVLHKKR